MEQSTDIDALIRARIRALRKARGWSLETLASRSHLSPSNLSRIETGGRRIAVDQLVPLARALDITLDQLVESPEAEDVVIRPQRDDARGRTTWTLARDHGSLGMSVCKMRLTAPVDPSAPRGVHPGRDWFVVLSGTAEIYLGERRILVEAGNAAEFSTMTPHAIGAHDGAAEVLAIWSRDAAQAHADPDEPIEPS